MEEEEGEEEEKEGRQEGSLPLPVEGMLVSHRMLKFAPKFLSLRERGGGREEERRDQTSIYKGSVSGTHTRSLDCNSPRE